MTRTACGPSIRARRIGGNVSFRPPLTISWTNVGGSVYWKLHASARGVKRPSFPIRYDDPAIQSSQGATVSTCTSTFTASSLLPLPRNPMRTARISIMMRTTMCAIRYSIYLIKFLANFTGKKHVANFKKKIVLYQMKRWSIDLFSLKKMFFRIRIISLWVNQDYTWKSEIGHSISIIDVTYRSATPLPIGRRQTQSAEASDPMLRLFTIHRFEF